MHQTDTYFVFGSNRLGVHGAGAARVARMQWGAKMGVGEGLTGRAYALPTKSDPRRTLAPDEVAVHVQRFLSVARDNPHAVFLLTKVGCGLAGFDERDIARLFADAPPNVVSIDQTGRRVGPAADWVRRCGAC
jgi:hypothetical protein